MDLSTWLNLANGRFLLGLMLFVRFGALLTAMPMLGSRMVPVRARVVLAAALAMILTPMAPQEPMPGVPLFIAQVLKEGLVGLVIGWAAAMVFSCVQMAGEWMDLQGGFQAGTLLNPTFDTQNAPIGNFKNMLAGVIFFGCNAHTLVLRAGVSSIEISPPGALRFGVGVPGDWTALIAKTFWIAVQLAAPVAAALFLVEIAIALANRALPQVNVMILSLPLKALLTVGAVALSIPVLARLMEAVFQGLSLDLGRLVQGMGG
jgi:flagellar biosynthetic protein FliR